MSVLNPEIKRCRHLNVQSIHDGSDGQLSILTAGVEVPFDIKRVYFINGFDEQESVRGMHAHKNLDQIIFCVSGSFILALDDGKTQQSLIMTAGGGGILIGNAVWHTMKSFSRDCVILVLASSPYDESDYIRDYNDFKRFTEKSNIF